MVGEVLEGGSARFARDERELTNIEVGRDVRHGQVVQHDGLEVAVRLRLAREVDELLLPSKQTRVHRHTRSCICNVRL